MTDPVTLLDHLALWLESRLARVRPPDPRVTALEQQMSEVSDKIAALKTATEAALSRGQADVDALKAAVKVLQDKVDAGSATPADLAALDALKATVDAYDPDPTNPPADVPVAPV